MVRIRLADEDPGQSRLPFDGNDKARIKQTFNSQRGIRQTSAKGKLTSNDSNSALTKKTTSDIPSKHHIPKQKRLSNQTNQEIRDTSLEDLQCNREKIMYTRLNKELFQNMKESILSLSILTNGLTEQVAQVREQQKHAKKLWNDLEHHLLRYSRTRKDERSICSPVVNEFRPLQGSTPAKITLPNIDSVKVNEVSRPNSLPSVFRDIHSPGQGESEVFTAAKTNNIKKVAKKRSREKSAKAEDLFPMVTQDLGMPSLQLKAKRNNLVCKKAGLNSNIEARERIEKRLVALESFQEKYIVQPNKSTSNSCVDNTETWEMMYQNNENAQKRRQKRDLSKKTK